MCSPNTIFKLRVRKLAHAGYDIIHIANQELGYAARMLKKMDTEAKIVTSIYDVIRVRVGFRNGTVHGVYNWLVTNSTRNAIEYSDEIIFSATSVMRDVKKEFPQLGSNWKIIYIGPPHEKFRRAPIPKKKRSKVLNVGFVGALSAVKNAIFILKTAELMKHDSDKYKFLVYGSGLKLEELKRYKEAKGLDNVTLPGFAAEKELLKIYDSFDVFFYPSFEEGTSIPVFDAQARGLPVILYGKTKMSDEVLAHSIIVDNEKEAANVLGRLRMQGYNAKSRSAEVKYARSFTWERVADETLRVYKQVLDNTFKTS